MRFRMRCTQWTYGKEFGTAVTSVYNIVTISLCTFMRIFCDITACSRVKAGRRFGGIYHFHLQSSVSHARNQLDSKFSTATAVGPKFTE
jgi:hypothetical protein